MRAGAVIGLQLAFIDPLPGLFLPGEIRLQTTAVKGIEIPRRVLETVVARVGLVRGVAEQHAPQLVAQGEHVLGRVQWVAQAVAADIAQCGQQVAPAQAGDCILHVHVRSGDRYRPLCGLVFHQATLRRQAIYKQINARATPTSCQRLNRGLGVGA
ncbi:hypothetical protein D3C78_862020 [compost metagenome]